MKTNSIPYVAFLLALAITATMDFTGYFNFSALPLLGIIVVFWFIQKQSKVEIGLVPGKLKYYVVSLMYPLFVLGATALIAYLAGDFSMAEIDREKDVINLVAGIVIGPLMVLLTEEGFFRGWLWGAFRKKGFNSRDTLFITSGLFVIWHISAVMAPTDYGLPISQIPIYLINAFLLALIWGTLRWASGSILVAAFCHAIWNAFAYTLFGFGEKTGLLGVTDTFLFGPEVGVLGIVLNGLFLFWLLRITKESRSHTK